MIRLVEGVDDEFEGRASVLLEDGGHGILPDEDVHRHTRRMMRPKG